MGLLEDTVSGLDELSNTINAIDLKLDEVRAYIQTLLAGGATPEQMQTLLNMVTAAKDHAAAVLTETDELDNPQP